MPHEAPHWLAQAQAHGGQDFEHFFDSRDIADDIYLRVDLSPFEIDLIDTPEFQRLFRLSQLGFVDLLFPTANHRRGTHSIGACGITKLLVKRVNENTKRVY